VCGKADWAGDFQSGGYMPGGVGGSGLGGEPGAFLGVGYTVDCIIV
jgi:hypothetical protein